MKTKAFTLIELLVVVAIIGILSAVGMVMFGGLSEKAKRNVTIANHNTLKKWIQLQIIKCQIDPNGKIIVKSNHHGGTNHFNCPMNAHASVPYFEDHFMYEGWENPYGTTPKPVTKGCYETQWQKKNNHGCIDLTAPDDKTFKLTTYYLDQDKNSQILTDTVTIE